MGRVLTSVNKEVVILHAEGALHICKDGYIRKGIQQLKNFPLDYQIGSNFDYIRHFQSFD